MFKGCSSLETLDLSNWHFSADVDVDIDGMLYGCTALKTITMKNCDSTTIRIINVALRNAGLYGEVSIITE